MGNEIFLSRLREKALQSILANRLKGRGYVLMMACVRKRLFVFLTVWAKMGHPLVTGTPED
jgi:hypothetical protein